MIGVTLAIAPVALVSVSLRLSPDLSPSQVAPRYVRADSRDLVTGADIHDLVVRLDIMLDELLEPIFGDIAEVDWVEHIPRLIDYWRWILLGYRGTRGR